MKQLSIPGIYSTLSWYILFLYVVGLGLLRCYWEPLHLNSWEIYIYICSVFCFLGFFILPWYQSYTHQMKSISSSSWIKSVKLLLIFLCMLVQFFSEIIWASIYLFLKLLNYKLNFFHIYKAIHIIYFILDAFCPFDFSSIIPLIPRS